MDRLDEGEVQGEGAAEGEREGREDAASGCRVEGSGQG